MVSCTARDSILNRAMGVLRWYPEPIFRGDWAMFAFSYLRQAIFFMEVYAIFHTVASNLRKAGKAHNASRHSPVVNNQSLPLLKAKGISRARTTWHLCPCVRIHDDVALFPLRSVVCGRDRTGNGACRQINVKRSLVFTDQIWYVHVHAHIVCCCTCTTDQLKVQSMCIRSFFHACLIAV